MSPFVCSVQPCDATKYEALGMCRTHYRASRPRRPDAKVALNCDGCGVVVMKEKRTRRYATVQCSDWLCRRWLTFGTAQASALPDDHMAVAMGKSCDWSPPRVSKPKGIPTERSCQWCAGPFTSARDDAKFCSRKCHKSQYKATRRGRENAVPGTYTWADIAKLWSLFDRACAYCSTPTPLDSIQAEHVVPISKRGANNLSNLLPSCRACNGDKRDLLLPDWAADRAARGKPPVRTTWANDDPLFKHLAPMLTLAA